ncbi:MAG TPA: GNAT family N-acetyltransferase [Thermoanaerobaculia bacterium]|jgi:GNAT superfamily N-acetyltransferase
MEWRRGPFLVSTDQARLDRDAIHAFLRTSYWAAEIPREIVDRSIENSLCFGVFEDGRQVAFARVVSDFATFAYLADVFVIPSHRGRGISKWLMEIIRAYPDLQNLRRWNLATRDAHSLYERFGFRPPAHPERLMEIVEGPDFYRDLVRKGSA